MAKKQFTLSTHKIILTLMGQQRSDRVSAAHEHVWSVYPHVVCAVPTGATRQFGAVWTCVCSSVFPALYITVWCARAHLAEAHRLTITDMWQEMAAHFSHEAGDTTIVPALQRLKTWKLEAAWSLDNSRNNDEKIAWEQHSTSLLSTKRMGITYSSE